MQFNEFNRRLNDAHMDQDAKYLLLHLFEVQMEMLKTLDATINVVNALADSVKNVVDLHENTQSKVKELTSNRHAEVRSVKGEDF